VLCLKTANVSAEKNAVRPDPQRGGGRNRVRPLLCWKTFAREHRFTDAGTGRIEDHRICGDKTADGQQNDIS
jgi:hypothetical protein